MGCVSCIFSKDKIIGCISLTQPAIHPTHFENMVESILIYIVLRQSTVDQSVFEK